MPWRTVLWERSPKPVKTWLAFGSGSRAVEMVHSTFSGLFIVIAESAATLIGLLFVAVTVVKGRANDRRQEIGEFRAAASLLAFTNALVVSLYGLVPGNNIGYPALILGVIGIFFAAAGARTTLAQPLQRQRRRRQAILIVGLMVVFGFQIVYGIGLVMHPRLSGGLSTIGDVLIASLLIGIGRCWELVGSWDTGIISSVGRLFDHQPPRSDEAAGVENLPSKSVPPVTVNDSAPDGLA